MIQNSTFNGNSTEYGAAVYTDEDLTIANSAFSQNDASEYGGGFEMDGNVSTLTGDTFTGNSAAG